jgi:hypothetical protein
VVKTFVLVIGLQKKGALQWRDCGARQKVEHEEVLLIFEQILPPQSDIDHVLPRKKW